MSSRMNSLAPDTTEILSDLAAEWIAHQGQQWRPGDIYAGDLYETLKATGQPASRSTLSKWLHDRAERGELIEIDGVIHPVKKRRCTVYRRPPALSALRESPGGDGAAQRAAPRGVRKSKVQRGIK